MPPILKWQLLSQKNAQLIQNKAGEKEKKRVRNKSGQNLKI
jgi:hypothetical protein